MQLHRLKPNAQYNLVAPGSFIERIGARVRHRMFDAFIERFSPTEEDTVLDIGVTSDQSNQASNYFEVLYPFKTRIVAAGIDEAAFLETMFPGIRFVRANALDMPFPDRTFDLVHSAAVIEHVGSSAKQEQMISECLRVARRGVCVTTPNRWFPIEFHTLLPFVHWLPKPTGRAVMRQLGYGWFALEENLNLLSRSELRRIAEQNAGWKFEILSETLIGLPSNLLLFAHRETPN